MTEIALALGCEARDLDALQYHPNGGLWPVGDAGLLDPRDDAGLRRRCCSTATASASSTSSAPRDVVAAAIVRECEEGRGLDDARRAARRCCSTAARSPPADAEISLPYMLRRYRAAGIDPLAEPIHTYPVLHYQNGGLVIDEHGATTIDGPVRGRRDHRRRARPQPHDGQLAARLRGLRLAGRARRRRRRRLIRPHRSLLSHQSRTATLDAMSSSAPTVSSACPSVPVQAARAVASRTSWTRA